MKPKRRSPHIYTEEDNRIMRELFPTRPTKEIADMLGVTVNQCQCRACKMGIKKDKEYVDKVRAQVGRVNIKKLEKYQFKKGCTSLTKGTKLSEEHKAKLLKYSFKQGHIPHNAKFNGAETIRCDKGKQYAYVRIAPTVWMQKQRYVWEQAHGKIPEGHKIHFKDGNTLNTSLENLELVSDAELMLRNGVLSCPEELRPLYFARSMLKREINKSIKKQKENGNVSGQTQGNG